MDNRSAHSRELLVQAALELYRERGYSAITAAEIAARAGLTERTFFRHFVDKRELLFTGGDAMEQVATHAIRNSGADTAFDRTLGAIHALVPMFEEHPQLVRERQRIIASDVDLQERELTKRMRLSRAITAALVAAGFEDSEASIASALSMVVLQDAVDTWLRDDQLGMDQAIRTSAASLIRVVVPSTA